MLKNFLFVALGGALGATSSTYSVHSVALLQDGRYGATAIYVIGTVILC